MMCSGMGLWIRAGFLFFKSKANMPTFTLKELEVAHIVPLLNAGCEQIYFKSNSNVKAVGPYPITSLLLCQNTFENMIEEKYKTMKNKGYY